MKRFFEKYPEIYAVLSEKEDGSMKILEDGGNEDKRKSFFRKIGIDMRNVVGADLVHGNNIAIINDFNQNIIKETDGLVTKNKEISLAVTVADCIPVFFFDPEEKIIAVSHCGWRGIVDGIIGNTVRKIEEIGGKYENIEASIGPGINTCHFEIKEDVLGYFKEHKEFIEKEDSKTFVDLKGIIRKQLNLAGVGEENIENDNECTFESEKYFSYRRDKPEIVEAMIAVIGFRK